MGKFSRHQMMIFSYFSQKIVSEISCKLFPEEKNLHKMSRPTFWEKEIEMTSAEIYPQQAYCGTGLICSFTVQ